MTDPDLLNVWFEDRLVGHLRRTPAGAVGFSYAPDWAATGGFPISCSLPLAAGDMSGADNLAHRFFANLLPEGEFRAQLVGDRKIANTDFDLLRAIGGECAGALSILPAERAPARDASYRPLADADLARLVEQRGRLPAGSAENARPRLSLAGAQHKFPVLIRDGRYFLPQGEAPTSHILKIDSVNYKHVPAFETFTSDLARQVGLPVVDIELCSIGERCYAQSERYDRVRDARGNVRRLHQEDFCQALGYGHEKKYQTSGGPTFADCFRLLREVSTDPAVDAQYLLRWQIFNVLAGNADGHAKNLSLLYLPDGEVRLAPFYDLICTRAIESIDRRLAFDVGGQQDPGQVSSAHWRSFAEACDVGARFLERLLQETAISLRERFDETKALFEVRHGEYPALQRIERWVKRQCRRAI